MKKADMHGIVHYAEELFFKRIWATECNIRIGPGPCAHNDTPITCLTCLSTPPIGVKTHRALFKENTEVRENGYVVLRCAPPNAPDSWRLIDPAYIDNENPSCARCCGWVSP